MKGIYRSFLLKPKPHQWHNYGLIHRGEGEKGVRSIDERGAFVRYAASVFSEDISEREEKVLQMLGKKMFFVFFLLSPRILLLVPVCSPGVYL